MEKTDRSPIQVAYQRRNRDLDPQLVWRGKDGQDWSDLVVQAPPPVHPGEGPPQGSDRRHHPLPATALTPLGKPDRAKLTDLARTGAGGPD
ncbi:MAG: hypothetical protein OXC31_26285 [Spirochaetaceae bacterium]|nr:hypothetical protein [Spirochaetaceae bacterium]